ncbi:MAG: hypothetical protein ACI8RU_002049 [Zhongshania aliphaticivorans]|jgi:hypothetical protein
MTVALTLIRGMAIVVGFPSMFIIRVKFTRDQLEMYGL